MARRIKQYLVDPEEDLTQAKTKENGAGEIQPENRQSVEKDQNNETERLQGHDYLTEYNQVVEAEGTNEVSLTGYGQEAETEWTQDGFATGDGHITEAGQTQEGGSVTGDGRSPEAGQKKKSRRKNGKGIRAKAWSGLTEKEKTIQALKGLLIKAGVIAAVVVILLTFVGGVSVCHDNNMFPAVKDGDLAITYKLGGYYNGDVIVYEEAETRKFGRVVGIPGDTIDFNDDGTYNINGTVPYETIYFATKPVQGSPITFPYTVKEGEVFVFNDMREDTNDSRLYGGITEPKGKVVLLLRRRGF